jgi:hypothetical protein
VVHVAAVDHASKQLVLRLAGGFFDKTGHAKSNAVADNPKIAALDRQWAT